MDLPHLKVRGLSLRWVTFGSDIPSALATIVDTGVRNVLLRFACCMHCCPRPESLDFRPRRVDDIDFHAFSSGTWARGQVELGKSDIYDRGSDYFRFPRRRDIRKDLRVDCSSAASCIIDVDDDAHGHSRLRGIVLRFDGAALIDVWIASLCHSGPGHALR